MYEPKPIPKLIEENLSYEKLLVAEIKAKQKCLDALKDQTFNYIKKLEVTTYFDPETLRGAFKYISSTKKKEASQDSKDSYQLLKYMFNKMFKGYEYKITDCSSNGWASYSYSFYVKVQNKELEVIIPNIPAITKENLELAHMGQYTIFEKTNTCTWSFRGGTYKLDEINSIVTSILEGTNENN